MRASIRFQDRIVACLCFVNLGSGIPSDAVPRSASFAAKADRPYGGAYRSHHPELCGAECWPMTARTSGSISPWPFREQAKKIKHDIESKGIRQIVHTSYSGVFPILIHQDKGEGQILQDNVSFSEKKPNLASGCLTPLCQGVEDLIEDAGCLAYVSRCLACRSSVFGVLARCNGTACKSGTSV